MGLPLLYLNQWDIKLPVNRSLLWKMQDRWDDDFDVLWRGGEYNDTQDDLYSPRPIRMESDKDYVIMGQAGRVGNAAGFISEGSILMT